MSSISFVIVHQSLLMAHWPPTLRTTGLFAPPLRFGRLFSSNKRSIREFLLAFGPRQWTSYQRTPTGQVCDLPPVGVLPRPADIPGSLVESRLAPGSWRPWPAVCRKPESRLGFSGFRPNAHFRGATSRLRLQPE